MRYTVRIVFSTQYEADSKAEAKAKAIEDVRFHSSHPRSYYSLDEAWDMELNKVTVKAER